MDTKLIGDIGEQAVVLECLKRGWNVLTPVGDRLPYDILIEINNCFIKIQVKVAWLYKGSYITDNRRAKTNRKEYKIEKYLDKDFNFAIIFIKELNTFYVMPSTVFNSYGSGIALESIEKRQRLPRAFPYREAWDLINNNAGMQATVADRAHIPIPNGQRSSTLLPATIPMWCNG